MTQAAQSLEHERAGFDRVQAETFLRLLFSDLEPGERIDLRAFPDDEDEDRNHARLVGSIGEALEFAEAAYADGLNVYCGVATRRAGAGRDKASLAKARFMWTDHDDVDLGELRKMQAASPLPFGMVVSSSSTGAHSYSRMAEPFALDTAEAVARFDGILRGIADALGADRTAAESARILRIPGTWNYPNVKKRAKGRVPAPVTLVYTNPEAVCDPDTLDLFEQRGAALGNGAQEHEPYDLHGETELPDGVSQLIVDDPAVRARFERNTEGLTDTSPSGVDMALASLLAHRGVEGASIEAAIRASRAQHGEASPKASALSRTIAKALAEAKARHEQREAEADPGPEPEHLHEEPDARSSARGSSGPKPHRLDDLGNAERFVEQHGDSLRFDYLAGRWHVYDERRWAADEAGEHERRAKATMRALFAEAARAAHNAEAVGKHAAASQRDARVRAMLWLARSDLAIDPGTFDSDAYVLNCLNGTVDLRTGTLRPHRREDYQSKLAPVEFDLDARSELWEAFLERALPDVEVRAFARRAVGYTLLGRTGEDRVLFVYGPPRTGKGTFQSAIAGALGDYAAAAGLETFAAKRPDGGRAAPELVKLRGARMVAVYETERHLRLAPALLKTLAGSDPITVRDLYSRPVTFTPQFCLWIATNHRPRLPEDDDAVWERVLELPFRVAIPEAERRPEVRAELSDPKAHGAGILAWAVRGCLKYLAEGLNPPAAVREATRAYQAEMDPLQDFAGECLEFEGGAIARTKALRERYVAWCNQNQRKPVSAKRMAASLANRGARPDSDHEGRLWRGVRLATE